MVQRRTNAPWLIMAMAVIHSTSACAQTNTGRQVDSSFEVASVKPSEPPTGKPVVVGVHSDPGRITLLHQSVVALISRAYGVDSERISSGPDWIRSVPYDIVATLPPNTPANRIPALLQGLLADRFDLALRRETKDALTYALVIAKGGPKLKPSHATEDPSDARGPTQISSAPIVFSPGRANVGLCCGHAELKEITMGRFVDLLSSQTDRKVVDYTGLSGTFDISLHWAHDNVGPSPVGNAPTEPSIDVAIREQLGLKLESRRAPLEYLVVEHVQKPSSN